MNKEEFLYELSQKLSGLEREEMEERLSFYSEMIDDRMEDGAPEAEAVAGIGTPDEIAAQILSEIPLSRLVRERVAGHRKQSVGSYSCAEDDSCASSSAGSSRKIWKTVLLIVGSPVWGALLIAALAVVFSLYVALWAVVVSLWAVFAALAASVAGCAAAAVVMLVTGAPLSALAAAGAAALCAGLSILMFFTCLIITKGVVKLTKKMIVKVKYAFIRKGRNA